MIRSIAGLATKHRVIKTTIENCMYNEVEGCNIQTPLKPVQALLKHNTAKLVTLYELHSQKEPKPGLHLTLLQASWYFGPNPSPANSESIS